MKIKEGRLYFIKDEFLEKYGQKYHLMENKVEKGTKRPTYFCFKDNKNKVSKIIQREILEKAKNVLALSNRGIVATYTNLPEFIKEIKQEIIINKQNLSKLYNMSDNL